MSRNNGRPHALQKKGVLLMKAPVSVSLLMMLLVGCTAPAQLSTSSGKPGVFMTGVAMPGESRDAASGVPQGETAGQVNALVAGFPSATAALQESLTTGIADADIAPLAVRLAAVDRASASEQRAAILSQNEREETPEEEEIAEYDPWEPFNQKMFSFNRQVDRFVLKPVATVWNTIVPDLVQQSLRNALDNVTMPRRLVNNLLQLNEKGVGRELARFFINTTMGVGGFFDAASDLGIEKSDKDTGQTLGIYGVGPGPYLVLPFLPPLTVRDGIGFGIDGALDPLTYVSPFAASAGRTGGKTVNDRSLDLELFEEFEESALDLYAAVRSAYLERRRKAIADALEERR
jgi:phospholipid-binding lipoprotein MlaA